jgi:CheY-like chemotaxis protein
MDGWSVLAALREFPDLAGIPVSLHACNPRRQYGVALGAAEQLGGAGEHERLRALIAPRLAAGQGVPKILIVEEDADLRARLCVQVAVLGGDPIEAATAQEAQRITSRTPIALALIGLLRSDGSGLDVADLLRGATSSENISIVALVQRDLTMQEHEQTNVCIETLLSKRRTGIDEVIAAIEQEITAQLHLQIA